MKVIIAEYEKQGKKNTQIKAGRGPAKARIEPGSTAGFP
jgi:hypothetical protein